MKTTFDEKAYFRARYRRIKAERDSRRPPDPSDLLTTTEMAYIAGLIDGEGCFTISWNRSIDRFIPTVSVSMTHRGVMDWVATKLGTKASLRRPRRAKPHHRDQFLMKITGKRAIRLAERILPFLLVKKPQAEQFLLFRNTYISQGGPGRRVPDDVMETRRGIKREVSRLNHDLRPHPPTRPEPNR